MTDSQVLRYLELTDRRIFIILHSGIDWQPEYEQELKDIDREIAILRKVIDSALESKDACKDTTEEITAEMVQAVEKAQNYDYNALYERWPTMSPVEVIAECKEVLGIYDILQQAPEPLGLGCLNIDGFMESMQFLENFCMRYLVDIFFDGN